MRYQTIDTKTGEILHASNRHPLLQQLESRVRSYKRRNEQRWYISRAELHIASAVALSAMIAGTWLIVKGVI